MPTVAPMALETGALERLEGFCLAAGLVAGLAAGLVAGLAAGLVAGLVAPTTIVSLGAFADLAALGAPAGLAGPEALGTLGICIQ